MNLPFVNRLRVLAMLPVLAVGATVAPAQVQPAAAENRQDEIVNLERTVDASTDSFKILRSGDKMEVNRYVTKVYTLRHANPYEMLPYLRTIAVLEKGSVITAWNPQPEGPPLSKIQVNVPEFQIPWIDAAVAAYDVENFASILGDIKFSYRTRYRSAVEVADFIRTSTLSPDGLIRGDAATNTIYVQDSPSDFRRVLAQIQFYDIPTPQIELEVSLIELTETDQTALGLDWDAWKTALGGRLDVSASSVHTSPAAGGQLHSSASAFDGLLSIDPTAAARFLNYLADTGKAKIRARTNLTVSNGSVATLSSGTQIPEFQYTYSTPQARSVLKEEAAPAADPASEGLTVAFRPVIATDTARMGIDVIMRSPAGINKTGGTIYSDQRVSADLTLAPGELYKMGGIRRVSTVRQRKGVPGLRDIPLIKYLFSVETTLSRETELYLFLRPTWTAPFVPSADGMKGESPVPVDRIADILAANPNIAISPEDSALLQRYFDAQGE